MNTQPLAATTTPPMTRRDADFCARLARSAGDKSDPKLIWRAQHSWPFLVTGRISDAANRVWIVPSVTREGRRYHVNLKTGDCYSFTAAGAKKPCPHKRGAGLAHCCHYQAAERAEASMFGGNAAEYFAGLAVKEAA